MKKSIYLFIIVISISCSSNFTTNKSYFKSDEQVLLVKDLMDTIFQKEVLLKRYTKFNKSDTIYIKSNDLIGVNENWNNVKIEKKHKILIQNNFVKKHYFEFLTLEVYRKSVKIEVLCESTGNIIFGTAKLKGNVWDLSEIKSGIR
jgi:hypothetical protein